MHLRARRAPALYARILCAGFALGMGVSDIEPASAGEHYLGCHAVVCNNQIFVKDRSRYNDAITTGIREWNAVGPITIVLVEDRPNVLIYDYTNSGDNLAGYWLCNTKNIYLNTAELSGSSGSTTKRRWAALHEMGHMLGIGDHESFDFYGDAMYDHYVGGNSAQEPMPHDKKDNRDIWGPTSGGCVSAVQTTLDSSGSGNCYGTGGAILGEREPTVAHSGLVPDASAVLDPIDAVKCLANSECAPSEVDR